MSRRPACGVPACGRDLRREAPNYVMMAPYLLFFVTFTLLPVIMSVVLGFTNFNMLQPPEFVAGIISCGCFSTTACF